MKKFDITEIHLLGVPIHLLDLDTLLKIMTEAIQSHQKVLIPNYNLNAIRLIHQDADMRKFYTLSHYRHIDGMPLVFLAKILGLKVEMKHRVTYIDFAPSIFRMAAEKNFKVFFLGSKNSVLEKASQQILLKYPKLKLQCHSGFFDIDKGGSENKDVLATINQYDTDILILGMGMPRQEKWILENLNEITSRVILTGGAIMDYISGETPTPPRFFGILGLEWLYRLFSEPKRLWRRYLVDPWVLIPFLFNDVYCRISGSKQMDVIND